MTISIIKWAMSHAASLPQIFALAQAVMDSEGFDEKWEAVYQLGKFVIPLLSDFPVEILPFSEEELAASENEFCAAGLDLAKLQKIMPILIKFLPVFLELLKD